MKSRTRLDFTGLYEYADPFDGDTHEIADLTSLSGCTMYVDEEAEKKLRECISSFDVNGIHFLDNGNYHYVTRFFLERLVSPFSLLVFDHHTDDQEPAFAGIRSCGSWIRDAREDMEGLLKGVRLIQGESRITGELKEGLPVYVSIDLDVLSEKELKVNWDQGQMSLDILIEMIKKETEDRPILGVDICGGCLPEETAFLSDNKRVFNRLYKVIYDEVLGEA